ARKLRQSARITKLCCAPGNGGISREAECIQVDLKSLESIVGIATQLKPDISVVGPEVPLQLGIVDEFTRRGWPVFGPTKAAAQLETSKSFAKEFMQRHRIPTSHYAICDSIDDVSDALGRFGTPLVVKADGLAAGDGDTGPNTGGMGAYSIPQLLDEQMSNWLLQHVARPVIEGMKAEGMPYKGILYCGLMMTARGPMVLEFNCRFGDPETQPIMM